MKNFLRFLSVLLIWVFALAVISNPPLAAKSKADDSARLAKTTGLVSAQFDGNTIANWMQNQGLIVSHKVTGQSGFEWPKGSSKTADYASGLWLVGKTQDGQLRTASSEYSTEFMPGPILASGTAANPDLPEHRIYKINRDGTGDWDTWPFDQGAPALKAKNGSDSLDGSGNKIPKLIGDQTLWWVMNDLDPTAHAAVFSTNPMGVEEQVMVFGYNTSDPLGNIMFIQWTIINKSNTNYDSCFVAVWDDPDLGDAVDDLVGCDTTLSMGYVYNGGPVDATYGTTPPALGFDFFRGPENPKGSGNYLPMSSFVYYWNGAPDPYGDPEDATQMYNFMRGFANDGSSYIDDKGRPSKFVFSGDPVTEAGWLDSSPDDRRFLMASGPFALAAGDTQVIVGAKIIAPGTDNKSAISALRYFDSYAQNAFDNNFVLPVPPPPSVSVVNTNGKIVLNWQDDADKYKEVEAFSFSGYDFEGYNVYQGESESGPWKRIATFDKVSNFGIVFDNTFDAETGMILNQPVAFGANTGINRNTTVVRDAVSGLSLNNYQTYYFTVTSYAVNANVSPKIIESGRRAVMAVPSTQTLGAKVNSAADDTVFAQHLSGKSNGSVKAVVLNPAELTGHTYRVNFDTLGGAYIWNLTDVTSNQVKLRNQSNQSGDEVYQILDGMKVYVAGPELIVNSVTAVGANRWITWGAWGLSGWNGGIGLGFEFFGNNLAPGDYVPVQLRFAADSTSGPADGWASKGYVFWRHAGYAFSGLGYLPFSAWDVSDPANPRQLNICFVENTSDGDGKGNANLRWDMGGFDPATGSYNDQTGLGGREYVFIMKSSYNPDGGLYSDSNDFSTDCLYAMGAIPRGTRPYLQDTFTLDIVPNYVNIQSDVFEFTTAGPSVSTQVAKVQLNDINAVPNPYFGWNPAERTPTTRILRFTNLPAEKATIRIFDLAGNLVRVIDDAARTAQGTNGTAYAQWDLRNAADVPVASGMYLVHVDVAGVGQKVLKVAIINREERLLYY